MLPVPNEMASLTEMVAMKLFAAVVLYGAATISPGSGPRGSDPPSARFNTCQYMLNPYNDGPLMPT
ncbi:hypothetical protein [Mycobacterium intracellulare]|uniref:hypothetical protein n=1 Tax=Mycobacterium intracellulare TaxID=1767 RepID=UPI00080B9FFD|nr:hypothetical protein [Mycobacterium intracellulare]OCB14905.1 hypothetical protein A5644_25825 [Mycobacterium intracellulare subsp. yongonense]